VNGRPILYDAVLTSSNGRPRANELSRLRDFDASPGPRNPDDVPLNNPNPFEFAAARASTRSRAR